MQVDVTFERDTPSLIEQIGELTDDEPETHWRLSVEVQCYGRDTPATYWQPAESMEIEPVRAFREVVDEEGRAKDVEFNLARLSNAEHDRLLAALDECVRETQAESHLDYDYSYDE